MTAGDASVTLKARVTDSVSAGLVFAPYHFAEANVQALMPGVQNRVPVTISKS